MCLFIFILAAEIDWKEMEEKLSTFLYQLCNRYWITEIFLVIALLSQNPIVSTSEGFKV